MLQREKTPKACDREKLAWLRLSRTENVGPITFFKLIEAYGSAEEALQHLPDLAKRGGKSTFAPADLSAVEKEYETLIRKGGQMITANHDQYPALLKAIDDPPPVISVLGNTDLMTKSCLAIVGARNASINGRKHAEKLARDLGEKNQTIVSGMARGIDTAAHKGSIETGTIAVVAGGIDVVYPEENQGLYEQIHENGLIIAESSLGQKPFTQSFPRRNRIVSGLSRGVIVGEANIRSGSLITARLAGEQGRELMAIPGSPLDPRAAGPNHLIREGAILIRNAEDVFEQLMNFSGLSLRDLPTPANTYEVPFSIEEDLSENLAQTILEQLSHIPIEVDELIRNCHVNISALQTALLELELAGRIKRHVGNKVSLLEK